MLIRCWIAGALLSLQVLSGCSIVKYLGRQAWGQVKVLSGRQRISELLASREVAPDRRRKLELVMLARRYAHEEIGLRLTGSYTHYYDTGGRPVAYNLSAAPKDALKPKVWTFPIVGGLPYLGFFDREEARAAEQRLVVQGYDTLLRPVPAYSSLGWFSDPIYSSVLEHDPWQVVELVIHETTHTTIFLRGQVAFNESLAMFVGQQGTVNMMIRLLGPRAPEVRRYQQGRERRERFARLVSEVFAQLERLYRSALPRAEKLRRREIEFAGAQQRYKEIFPDPGTWGSFVRRRLNNAVLLSYGRYHRGIEFHRAVYRRLGRDLSRLVRLYRHAQHFDDPIAYAARACRLQRPAGQRM